MGWVSLQMMQQTCARRSRENEGSKISVQQTSERNLSDFGAEGKIFSGQLAPETSARACFFQILHYSEGLRQLASVDEQGRDLGRG